MCGQLRKSLSFWTSIFILVGVSITFAQSNPPPPTPSKTGQKPEANTAQHNEAPAKDQRGTESLPLVIKVVPPTTVEPESSKDHKETSDDTSAEWWLVYVTGVLCAITLALAFFTGWLWNATKKLVMGADRTAKHELRAYMGVDSIQIHQGWTIGSPNRGKLIIRNFGKTMAQNVRIYIASSHNDATDRFPVEDTNGHTVTMPGEGMYFEESIPLKPNTTGQLMEGRGNIYIWGRIDYIDVFQEPRWTTFRFVSDKVVSTPGPSGYNGWSAKHCEEGNDAY